MNPKTTAIIVFAMIAIVGGILMLSPNGEKPSTPPETKASNRSHNRTPSESAQERKTREERERLAATEREKMTALWSTQAASVFAQTLKDLVIDLELDTTQAESLKEVFARRGEELDRLFNQMDSGSRSKDVETFLKICGLIRNTGLRDDLASVLTDKQLAAFDARETKRRQETTEARAYRDMADINSTIELSESQKPELLGVLMNKAAESVEREANTRAFMSLTYGPLANELDASAFRGMTHFVNDALLNENISQDMNIDSPEYQEHIENLKAQRIENELTALRDVLDEKQLTRYRQRLEQEPAW